MEWALSVFLILFVITGTFLLLLFYVLIIVKLVAHLILLSPIKSGRIADWAERTWRRS